MISTATLEPARQLARLGDYLIGSVRGISPRSYSANTRGNELAGVLAADRVLRRIQERKADLRGEVVLLGETHARWSGKFFTSMPI